MKKKTPNAERRTPNIKWSGRDISRSSAAQKKTSNTERRTPNIKRDESASRVREESSGEYGPRRKDDYDLEDRLLDFAVSVVEVTEELPNTRSCNHLAGQLLRSGTSPYGHHGEVESAESMKDFIHKLKVCLKELRETRRWLRLVGRLKRIDPSRKLRACFNEAEELIRIFAASVRTAEKRAK